MAKLFERSKMPFWSLNINDTDLTSLLRNNVETMSVEYEINKIAKCEIAINSKSYIEDFFMEGSKIQVGMGFSPTTIIPMFKGSITATPAGQASDHISYTIIANNTIGSMGAKTQQRTFNSAIKSVIINTIIGENGYIPDVVISDSTPLPADQMPMQRNETDLEYLMNCAKRWGCVMWHTNSLADPDLITIHFHDADKAHAKGNLIKNINAYDLDLIYKLGYRSEINNIENIRWSFEKSQGTGNSVKGMDDDGADIQVPGDFKPTITDQEGIVYEPKQSYYDEIKKGNVDLAGKVAKMGISGSFNQGSFNAVKEYFVPVKKLERTNENKNPAYASHGIKLDIDLNVGDIYLRPPRQCSIISGVNNQRADTSKLPAFIRKNVLYNINKVKTTISSGKIHTSLGITL